jgi:hypothetical protein
MIFAATTGPPDPWIRVTLVPEAGDRGRDVLTVALQRASSRRRSARARCGVGEDPFAVGAVSASSRPSVFR